MDRAPLDLPIDTVYAAKEILKCCYDKTGKGSQTVMLASSIVQDVASHEINLTRFLAITKEAQSSPTGYDSNNIAETFQGIVDSRKKHQKRLEDAASVISDLIHETYIVEEKLDALRDVVDSSSASKMRKYFSEQRKTYREIDTLIESSRKAMNTDNVMRPPGKDYNLQPFRDVMLAPDGQAVVWNKEDKEWEFAEDLHPCQTVPGSTWSKFVFDLTPDFYDKGFRHNVTWIHATPAKKLLELLEDDQSLMMEIEPSTHVTPAVEQRILKNNEKIAAETGIPYPLYGSATLERETFDLHVQDLVNGQFSRCTPATRTPRLDHLSCRVEEIASCWIPEVEDLQEQERMEYALPH